MDVRRSNQPNWALAVDVRSPRFHSIRLTFLTIIRCLYDWGYNPNVYGFSNKPNKGEVSSGKLT